MEWQIFDGIYDVVPLLGAHSLPRTGMLLLITHLFQTESELQVSAQSSGAGGFREPHDSICVSSDFATLNALPSGLVDGLLTTSQHWQMKM